MTGAVVYLDSSALVKLIFDEEETLALEMFLTAWPQRASSALARIEVLRVSATVDDPLVIDRARDVLDSVALIRINEGIMRAAIAAEPVSLRALDAIHLGTALSLGAEMSGVIAYDRRLATAARRAGLTVWSPA